MQEAIAGTWLQRAHFSSETLAPLHDLNHRFLDLVAAHHEGWPRAGVRGEGNGELGRTLAALSSDQRHAAARCPYALFDLRFDDDAHWRLCLEERGAWRVADGAQGDQDCIEFVRLALFYAWHVASTAQLAAQLLLGMNEYTAGAFRAVTLNSLPYLASSTAGALERRFGGRDAFWRSLLGAAARSDATRLKRAQLFGLQLSAAARLP